MQVDPADGVRKRLCEFAAALAKRVATRRRNVAARVLPALLAFKAENPELFADGSAYAAESGSRMSDRMSDLQGRL